ncbi:MAG: hypothetical protein A2Y03_06485 [Omnitrophica WOR_2 bacterium GWF2_38_59]|nr:MAG: hypothetical protein A2Y03_06485 [Omnitrophica WOR_2 bacterium GWF2_38_59]OGX50502.1 MAG: hypothetical protein A2243_02090 [Omnitrophica WOR_2 bacterium RIFOXYA2_FULL_38_17]OGX54493.1 MAG: hypothetical protein A2267_06665 [Omnitrophica WOR_2 bacterium RIFOXYA12_FULL_38_10]OGX55405.1 MAG: hypothetical protein A2447_11615 [Omnitrophica WOR_2 bacterium RIFOXYC2_FULL_38_12]OGX59511.1 MAG: hypothetical protein A2306_09715 [Omnitrophica WOR_2 bacterium RIFOXYB2_FULL_38_16]HBG62022.1 hypothet
MKSKVMGLFVFCALVYLSSPVFAGVDYSIKAMEYDSKQFISRTNNQLKVFKASRVDNTTKVDRRAALREFKAHYDRMISDAKQKLRDFREYVSLQTSSLENTRIRQRDTQDMINRNRIVFRDKDLQQKEVLRNNKEKLQALRLKLKEQTRR